MDDVIFQTVSAHFRMELKLFWTRANFYLLIEASLITFTASFITNPIAITGISLVGVILGVFWFLVNNGTAFWIKRWREQIIKIDNVVNRFKSYSEVEPKVKQNLLKSPTFITLYLPWIFILIWCILLIYHIYILVVIG